MLCGHRASCRSLATALNGFKELGELQANPFGLPRVWVWRNYWEILSERPLLAGARQFAADRALTVAADARVSSMAAFTFAHLRFFGDRFLLSYFSSGSCFRVATAILPLFIKVRDLGLLDSYWGVVLPQVAFSLAMSVLLLRTAFKQLPFGTARCGDDGWLRLLSLFSLHHPAAVRADPVDGRDHFFRRQLERLPACR